MFVCAAELLGCASAAVRTAGLESARVGKRMEVAGGQVGIGAMHMAKGLGFQSIAVIPCNGQIIPPDTRPTQVADESRLENVYHSEHHLLYDTCMRTRDHCLLTAMEPGSAILEELA